VDCSQGAGRGALIATDTHSETHSDIRSEAHSETHSGNPAPRTIRVATDTDVTALAAFMLNRLTSQH
jgi:hypothetical protein